VEQLGAILAGAAGLIATIAAVLIAIRHAKGEGRKDALAEADEAEAEVARLREQRVADAQRLYALELALVEHGIEPP
jgi:hypothetical protein